MTDDTKRATTNDQSGREGNQAGTSAEQSTHGCKAPTQGESAEYLAPDPTAAPAQGEPQYCEHAWKYGGRHAGCVVNCGLPRRPPTAAPAQGEPQAIAPHIDDVGVDRLAAAMKAKLAEKRAEGYGGWNDPDECPPGRLAQLLHDHLSKGDPLDIANFAMMLWNRGESCATRGPVPPSPDYDDLVERIRALADCLYWATAGWDIPGDATQKIGRLAVKAADAIAALRAERDALRAELAEDAGGWARAERAEAECDALRADAERYRWLRAAQSQTARNWIVINNRNMYGEHELDAAIDAARKERP